MAKETAAERAVRAMSELNRRIGFDLDHDPMRMPFWYLHLPSGGVLTVKGIGVEGPLIRFVGFWATASTVEYVLVAPEAVVVTIESAEELAEPPRFDFPPDDEG
jgi:hypothetical protein